MIDEKDDEADWEDGKPEDDWEDGKSEDEGVLPLVQPIRLKGIIMQRIISKQRFICILPSSMLSKIIADTICFYNIHLELLFFLLVLELAGDI